jgi:hypothetical protein
MKYIIWILVFISCFAVNLTAQVIVPDSGFRACLTSRYPSVLDKTTGNIIPAEAAKFTGKITCLDFNIKNPEGIQYFINVAEIELKKNSISFLPDLSGISGLRRLDFAENQVQMFPALPAGIKVVEGYRNSLAEISPLSGYKDLEVLSLHSNKLKRLPALSALRKLRNINVAHNEIDSLPDLSALDSLQYLHCWVNRLACLPDLRANKLLLEINAGYNQIDKFPLLGDSPDLNIIYLPFNRIDSIPDISRFKKLLKVRLYGNHLTFDDLLPLTSIPGYDTLVPVVPQEIQKTGYKLRIIEGEKLVLNPGFDEKLTGAVFTWKRKNKIVSASSKPYFVVNEVKLSDEAFYYVEVTHPAFPELVISSDSFKVNVEPCIIPANFSTEITSISCEKRGSLKLTPFNQPVPDNFQYKLYGTADTLISMNGEFNNLAEENYRLVIYYKKCFREYPQAIIVSREPCESVFITPDGNNVDDDYFFPQTGKATIRDKHGNEIYKLQLPGKWNGTGYSGLVSPGLYFVDIQDGHELIKVSVIY